MLPSIGGAVLVLKVGRCNLTLSNPSETPPELST